MKIIVGFSKHKGFAIGSSLIRWFMKKPFSHTYFKFKEGIYPESTIFHAVGKGTVYVSESTFLDKNVQVAEFAINISKELYIELLQDCHAFAGRDYGYMQNLGLAAVRCLNKVGFRISKNPVNDGINCSEWIYYVMEEIYGKWTKTEPNLVAPDECYNYLASKGKALDKA